MTYGNSRIEPKWGNVRKLLLKCFTKEQLLEFCLVTSDFEDLYESLAEGDAQKGEIIREIIAHAKRIGKIKIILNWAKSETDRYEEFVPYYCASAPRTTISSSNVEGQPQSSKTEATMPKKFKYDVFISHASEDKPIIEQLTQDFKRARVTYWVDHEQIDFGDRITEKIEEGLRQSKYVLVCLSANLGRSNWVRAEYGPILNKELGRSSQKSGRKVIPLRLDDSSDDEIPLLLYDKRRANYSNVTEFNQLLEFLKRDTPDSNEFDVFLAHNSEDKPQVEAIAKE